MNEDNPPMAFPENGYVYSRDVSAIDLAVVDNSYECNAQALLDMASKNNGVVTCPRSGVSCSYAVLRKVYIS
jgi:macrophage erythroblast attacher